MKMKEAKITSKGQITIPKEVRKALGLKEGKEVVFIIGGGEAIMKPKAKNPMEELVKLREKLPLFTKKEIETMIKESKKEWSKIE
jgi:antitoxin PrlF